MMSRIPSFLEIHRKAEMAVVKTKESVVKLVHRGPHVEIHRQPVTAFEVMNKNPRHSVTRPDFFEYPWIVVKPESVLNTGRVYFVVPNRVIRELLKTRTSSYHQSSQQIQSSKVPKLTAPTKSFSRMTTKRREERRLFKQKSETTFPGDASLRADSTRCRKKKEDESWVKLTHKHKDAHIEFEVNPETEIRPFSAKDYYLTYGSNISEEFAKRREESETELEHSKEKVTTLKSCLRKEGSVCKSRGLRVYFLLPTKEEEHDKRDAES